MSFSLTKWSFAHATLCLVAICLVVLWQSPTPLFVSGLVSFGLLIYLGRPIWTPHFNFGVANLITLSRLSLTLILFYAATDQVGGIFVFVIALAILINDGLDGWAARRRNEASEFGEYFDKETDAFFLLTLCLLAYFKQKTGAWIIIPGLLRYVFVVFLALLKPEINKEYRSKWARVIYVTMIIALLAVFITPSWFYNPLLAIGTTGLFLSFAHYFAWLFSGPQNALEQEPYYKTITRGTLAFLFLNSLLLVPSLVANFSTSSFFPIPDTSQPIATLTWTRGWYDYLLYFFIRRPNQDIFRICADLILLITALTWWQRKKDHKQPIPKFFLAIYLGLLIYEIYDAMVFQFFHRHGLLYEDAQYVLNLYYLAIDALSIQHLFSFILIATGIVLFAWWLPSMLRAIIKVFDIPKARKLGLVFSYLFWPIFAGAWMWYGPGDERPTIRSITGKIVENTSESINLAKTIAAVEQLPVDEVYNNFDRFTLDQRPNIYMFMIESYGRILRDNAYLRPTYDSLILDFEDALSNQGWHSASRYSQAPVSGGLSWLSMSSVLSGLFMKNKTFFTRYLSRIHAYPHLVRFLKQQGYYTVTLQPPNKARLGLPIENNYDFDRTVFFDDLHYKGPPYSIWIIPDQYSLGYTHENYLPEHPSTPYFLFFETATTHAPWTDLPPYMADWQHLNEAPTTTKNPQNQGSLLNLVKNSYNNRFYNESEQAPDLYLQSITYDLRLLIDYILNQAPDNSLAIILGDHQPPLLPSTNYDTPIHVISKDSVLLDHFDDYGFTKGMLPDENNADVLTHAGIYSMFVDVITFNNTLPDSHAAAEALPSARYRPQGVAPSILTINN